MTVTERCKTFRYYCLMPVHARGGLTVTEKHLYILRRNLIVVIYIAKHNLGNTAGVCDNALTPAVAYLNGIAG